MNEPGIEVDGPFRIPKLYDGRNRTFFTYAQDIYRDNRPTGNTLTSPTLLERSGDFSKTFVSGVSGPAIAIYDPVTTLQNADGSYVRTPFPGGVIPPSRINPIAGNIAKFYLAPTQIAGRTQPNVGVYPNYDHEPFNSHVFRFDHKLSDKQTVFVKNVMFPEGAMWLNGSLYVAAPPHIWKFTDTDGDGVAEKPTFLQSSA